MSRLERPHRTERRGFWIGFLRRYFEAPSPFPPPPPPSVLLPLTCRRGGFIPSCLSDDAVSTCNFDRGFTVIVAILHRIEPLDNSAISKGVSPAARDSAKQTISTMLGLFPSDHFSVIDTVSKHPLHRLLFSSHRNNGNQDEHPSGVPRPYGGGRGRGRGRGSYNNRGDNSNNERQDSGYGGRWGSNNTKDSDDGLSNFPGAKVQNSPGREAFPGGWGGGGSGGGGASNSDNGGWEQASGGAGPSDGEQGSSGWGSATKKAASGNGWGSGNSGGGW
ncbi:hypothetical protein GmHk_19G055290 [Glycine max]|nr:hypothetical protein GmHk_19G055290 [Glycine max]